jgi:hypothetical protein
MKWGTWAVFAAIIVSGCLSPSPEENRFLVPSLRIDHRVVYDHVGDDGQAIKIEISLEAAEEISPLGDRVPAVVIRVEAPGMPPGTTLFGRVLPAQYIVDRCLYPMWQVTSGQLSTYWAHRVPAIVSIAGLTILPFHFDLPAEERTVVDFGRGFIRGHYVPENEYPVSLWRHNRVLGTEEVGEHWQARYEQSAVPVEAIVRTSLDAKTAHLRLVSEQGTGEELASCSTPWAYRAPKSEVAVGQRGPEEDPPLPVSLREAIRAAEADPTLVALTALLRDQPQAYLMAWEYVALEYAPAVTGGAWDLGFTAPGEEHEVRVRCRPAPPSFLLWTCEERVFPRDGPAPERAVLPVALAGYAHPFDVAKKVSTALPCRAEWTLAGGHRLVSCDGVEIRFDGLTGDVSSISGLRS